MKIKINRNILWCDVFTNRLSQLGVKDVCISAGSRSTPLTLSFNMNKNFSIYRFVDERSSAFFALGMAKKTRNPIAIITTSGTAVAELYPAIIEAYYQRIPLIICTADRPNYLKNIGANQTINQNNIYSNHIRFFSDAGLPDINKLGVIRKIAEDAFIIANQKNRGPVHINFPFEKPFEPDSFTDSINENSIKKYFLSAKVQLKDNLKLPDFDLIAKNLDNKKGIILVGSNGFDKDFPDLLMRLSNKLNFPIVVDGASSLRFGKHVNKNIIDNFTTIVRSKIFVENFQPEVILQFGAAPTSNVVLEYFKNSTAQKIIVNQFGDLLDPSRTANKIIKIKPSIFCKELLKKAGNNLSQKSWKNFFIHSNEVIEKEKEKFFSKNNFPFESKIIYELLRNIQNKSNLFVSNSLPIRDFDFFASKSKKEIKIFTNRGASGIDGINSTALAIAHKSNGPTFLVTGDLAFFHDLNGLFASYKYKIPITIVLINNNGGGIFESLPISIYKEYFEENFLMPLNLNFKKIVESYNGIHKVIKNWKRFTLELNNSQQSGKLTVLEIKTDAKKSKDLRNNFWHIAVEHLNNYINEIKS